MKRNLSVRSLLLLLALSFTTLPVVLFGVYEASRGVESAIQEADENNRRAALLLQKDINLTIDQFRALFEALAVDVDLQTLRFRDPARVRNLLEAYPQALAILLLNKDAVSVASYSVTLDLNVGVNYSDREQVQRALETRRTAISGNLAGRAAGIPTIVFSVPLIDDNGAVAGLLNGAVPPEQFKAGYELTGDQFATVLDAYGRVVSSKGSGNFETAANDMAALHDGFAAFNFADSETQVFTATVAPIGWKIIVGVPRNIIVSRSREAVRRAGVLALICGTIGAVIAGLIAFSTVRGLDSLGRQIRRMSAVDLKPIEISRPALFPVEIRTLIGNFNDLLGRAARTRHAEFEAISSVADTIFIARASGEISYVNETGVRLFGAIQGKYLNDVLGVEIASTLLKPVGSRALKIDLSIKKIDGTTFDGFLSSTPIIEEGSLTTVVVIIQDITSEKAAREALIQSEKMITLGELVAGTSHELNNPLAIVTGYSDLLLEDEQLTPEQRSKVTAIRKSTMRASKIVHSLLAFARKRKPERVRTDVNGVVEASIGLKDYDLRTSGITIEKHLTPSMPAVFADPNQMQQILLNIINNAQDAVLGSTNPPKIVIRTGTRESVVYIRIEDSGTGISKTDLKKVFDPFFTTKPLGKGTGLGLSISYGIVREHGGEIQIQSQLGYGTKVSIELPVDQSVSHTTTKPERVQKTETRRFLVVDDEPEIISIMQSALTRDGASIVDTASTVTDALALARSNMYDFIVTDIKMPSGSGIDLYKQLAAISPSYERRVVFLTGDTSNPATIEFLESEGLPYLSKPFDFQLMEDLLKKV